MFTQLFGNYLLHKKLVTKKQLVEALKKQSETRLKLGILAINESYMTAKQVDEVHMCQMQEDRMFGEIAQEKGYLTEEQLTELLCQQHTSHLLLGQTLVDMGILTTERFENALDSYKRDNGLTDYDFSFMQKKKIFDVVNKFLHFSETDDQYEIIIDYICLLFKDLLRFIGDDFVPADAQNILYNDSKYLHMIEISGAEHLNAAIECDNDALIEFAARYSQEEVTQNDDYARACIGEFLNLQCGLFTVNLSNDHNIELTMTPPMYAEDCELTFENSALLIPVCFSFGEVNFLISKDKPLVN